jgi:hypothetical protein
MRIIPSAETLLRLNKKNHFWRTLMKQWILNESLTIFRASPAW